MKTKVIQVSKRGTRYVNNSVYQVLETLGSVKNH